MTKCPKCNLQWSPPCDQTACIELFGECISCRRFKLTEDEIKQIQASVALERKAENARELGLDYEPNWKEEYQKAVDLHCITLDELREANAWIKNLEKLMAARAHLQAGLPQEPLYGMTPEAGFPKGWTQEI